MDGFQPARDQDAWATLRGFRYQIDLTIQRWLLLDREACLELERGEDIDVIAHAATVDGDGDLIRTLEQVKVRERKISLRSEEALHSLVNAHAQLIANPGIKLRFCYSTNARVARERPNPFPRRVAGIILWDQVRRQTLAADEHSSAVVSLRSFLALISKPGGIEQENWDGFVRFMADAADSTVVEFIRRFEWSCGLNDPEDATEEVKRQLERVADMRGALEVEELYQRLFLFVLQLLTQPGVKRLTRTMLIQQFTAPTLSSTDRAVLRRFQERIKFVESRLEQVAHSVSSVSAEVRLLVEKYGASFAAVRPVATVVVDAPPLVEHLCTRDETVVQLKQKLSASGWLALFGTTDTGKTHLASLVLSDFANCGWIRLHHAMPAEQANLVFQDALRLLAKFAVKEFGVPSYAALCRSLGKDSSLIVDDVPRLQNDDALTEGFVRLALACRDVGIPLTSTSRFQLPGRMASLLGNQRLCEIVVPPFTVDEARSVLALHGAPEAFLEKDRVAFIRSLASGHPFLLTQVARFLAQRKWQFHEEELAALVRGDHTSGIADEVISRICKSLTEPQRDLLYRLSLATRPLREPVIMELAEVAPPVLRPRECLTTLTGAWIQREDAMTFAVSPVVVGVVGEALGNSIREQCHLILGHGITREPMDPWDAHYAIRHFLGGKAYNAAGALLLELLQQFKQRTRVLEYRPLLNAWSQSPLPAQMHLGLRLMIRAMQFWTFPSYGVSDDVALTDLDSLMSQATALEAVPAFNVASLAILFLSERDFTRSLRYFMQATKCLRDSDVPRDDLVLPSKEHPVELLWTSITNIKSDSDLAVWMEVFDSLTPSERKVVMGSPDAKLGSMVLADRLMAVEINLPESERNWTAVLQNLRKLFGWALGNDWEYLAASALKSIVNVHGEFLKDVERCGAEVSGFVNDASRSESAKSLVSGMYGKMLASRRDHDKALPWLERAIACVPAFEGHDRLMTFLAAAKCCRDTPERSIRFTALAVDLVERTSSISDVEAAKAHVEHAIAVLGKAHTRDGALKCYPAWSKAAEKLLTCEDRDNSWKDLFVLFGHIQSFIFQLATTGQAPTHASDGSPYAAPYQGICATTHSERCALFHDESVPGIMWFQGLFARAADDEASADRWLQRAVDAIANMPLTHVTALIQQEMIPSLLQSGRYADAFEAGIRGTEASVALREASSKKTTPHAIPFATPLEQLVGEMSADGHKLADRFGVIAVAVPAVMRTAIVAIRDPEAGADAARQFASLCRQVKSSGEPKYWIGSAAIFEAMSSKVSAKELFDLAHSFDESTERELRVMGYLAASTSGDLEAAFQTQLASMQLLQTWYSDDTGTYLKVVLPFVEMYWTAAFRRERFRFRSPAVVEAELQAAVKVGARERVRAILRAVRPSFHVSGLIEADAWLRGGQA